MTSACHIEKSLLLMEEDYGRESSRVC